MRLPEWKKNLAAMWFAQLSGMGAITGVLAFLPLYVPQLGINTIEETSLWSGILLSSASLFAALSGPHWGAYADRSGRKLMVQRAMASSGLLMIVMAFAVNVYQMLALRIFQGIFGGFTAAALALVTSMAPPEEIGFTMGVYQTAMIAGSTFGPFFGGLIADHFGYRQAFMAFGTMCLISLVIIQLLVTEHFTPVQQAAKPSVVSQSKEVLAIPGLRSMLFIQFLIQFAIQAIAPILPLFVKHLAPDSTYIASTCGTIIAAAGLTSAMASASMGPITHRYSHKTILSAAGGLSALSFGAQALANSVYMLGITRGISGFFMGAMLPSVNSIIFLLIPPEKRGVAFGVSSSAALMGNVVGPMAGGILALYFGTPSVFWLTAALFVLVSAWAAMYVHVPDNSISKKSSP